MTLKILLKFLKYFISIKLIFDFEKYFFLKSIKRKDLNEEEKAKLIASRIFNSKEKSRLYYRIQGTRELTASRKSEIKLQDSIDNVIYFKLIILLLT